MKTIAVASLTLVLFWIAPSTISSEAITLPPGTTIGTPAKTWTLDATYFLLNRTDMEAAVLAMETVSIREQEIEDLKAAYKGLELRTYLIAGGVGLGVAVVTIAVVELLHLVGK